MTLKAGNLKTELRPSPGFTLIELVVAVSILGMVMFFVLPVFNRFQQSSENSSSPEKIADLINALKKKSLAQSRSYTLHIDAPAARLWITHGAMDSEALEKARENKMGTEAGTDILDVLFFSSDPRPKSHARIRFSRQGYSDWAMIHLRDQDGDITIMIEPFLLKAEIVKGYELFKDCI